MLLRYRLLDRARRFGAHVRKRGVGHIVMRKAAAAVSVRSYFAWKSTAAFRLLGGAQALVRPRGRRGAGHNVSPRAQLV